MEAYTPHDKVLRDAVIMNIGPPANLLSSAMIGTKIKLQFPPKVTSDGKKSDWKGDKRASYEPIRTWNGADARRVGIEIKYVVSGMADWSAKNISSYAREFKRIHYGKTDARGHVHLMEIKLYDIIGKPKEGGLATFLVMDTDVKYSPNYVKQGDVIWPKITTISLNCELVTQVFIEGELEAVRIGNVRKAALPEWY